MVSSPVRFRGAARTRKVCAVRKEMMSESLVERLESAYRLAVDLWCAALAERHDLDWDDPEDVVAERRVAAASAAMDAAYDAWQNALQDSLWS